MSKSRYLNYENEIRPLIQKLGSSNFKARDLSPMSSYSPQGLGSKLKSAAEKDKYDIKVVDRFPYVFSVPNELLDEDRNPERNENAEYLEIFQIRDAFSLLLNGEEEIDKGSTPLDEVYNALEEEDEISEKEARNILSNNINSDLSLGTQISREGELFQEFKEYRDVTYIPEEKKFTLGEK